MTKKILFLIVITGLVFLLPLIAISEEGVTDTEIRIAQFGPLTGPAAPWGQGVLQGAGFFIKIINDEGGVYGRKIVYRPFNDDYNPAKTKYGVKELQEKVGIFAWIGGIGTEPSLAVKQYLINKKVPWLTPMAGSKKLSEIPNRYIFTGYPLNSSQAKILCRYAVKNMGKKRIAMVYQNDGYGKDGLEGAIKELKKYNMNLAAQISITSDETNLKSCAQILAQADSDTVLIFTTPFAAMRLMKTAVSINFSPQWMGGVSFSGFDIMYMISKGMWKGMITTVMYNDIETPLLQKYKTIFANNIEKNVKWDQFFIGGIVAAELLAEGLKRCGRDLTRERFVDVMERLDNFNGIACPFTFKPFDENDPECRKGLKNLKLIQCLEGGETKFLTDWIKID